jgi:hypothetical protein
LHEAPQRRRHFFLTEWAQQQDAPRAILDQEGHAKGAQQKHQADHGGDRGHAHRRIDVLTEHHAGKHDEASKRQDLKQDPSPSSHQDEPRIFVCRHRPLGRWRHGQL